MCPLCPSDISPAIGGNRDDGLNPLVFPLEHRGGGRCVGGLVGGVPVLLFQIVLLAGVLPGLVLLNDAASRYRASVMLFQRLVLPAACGVADPPP